MKFINFLFSIKTKKLPKRGLLLDDNTIAVIDQTVGEEERVASDKAKKVITDCMVEEVIWWWPEGRAFREIYGVSDFAISRMLTDYGFNISSNFRLIHKQVDEDDDSLEGYFQIKLSLNDEKYAELTKEYGNIKVINVEEIMV